jgi:cob(I)alamin adenosyltransferase
VDCLVRLAALDEDLGDDRVLNLPSLSVTVEEMVECVRRVAAKLNLEVGVVEVREDSAVVDIVRTWARWASAERARALGLPQDRDLDSIVSDYLSLTP